MFRTRIFCTMCPGLRRWLSSQAESESNFCFGGGVQPSPLVLPCAWSVLPNGVRVISEQRCSPFACAALFVETGPRYEHHLNNGISNFVEFVAYKGYCRYQKTVFLNYMASIGAKFWSHTTREWQAFVGTSMSDNIGDVINVLSRIINDLMLDDCEVEIAKAQYEHMICDVDRDPKGLVFDFLHEGAFQGTPLGMTVSGPSRNLDEFCRETVKYHIATQYQPYRLVVAVSSMFNHHDVVNMVQNDFGNLSQTCTDNVYWPCRYCGSDVRFRDDFMDFSHNIIAVEAAGFRTEDYMALKVMESMLGDWNACRAQGLATWPRMAHGAEVSKLCSVFETFYIPYRDTGLFGVYYVAPKGTELDDMLLFITTMWRHFALLTIEPELEYTKNNLKMKFARSVDGCINSVMDMGEQMLYMGCRRNLVETFAEVDAVKTSTVKEAGHHYFYDRCPTVAALGPIETQLDYTRVRSAMYWLGY